MTPNQEKYYWLFSSSSQAIAAFIAFLVAGFTLVLNMMEALQQKDETLADIHHQLKSNYYKKLFVLTVISGLAIIFSFWMIYLNGGTWSFTPVLFLITSVLNVTAIGLAIVFIISIINPEKYKNAAKEILDEDKTEFTHKGNEADRSDFLNEFMELEKKVRHLIQDHKIVSDDLMESSQFRQLVKFLFERDIISKEQLYELLQITKYRNLIFHSGLQKVDIGMIDRIRSIRHELDELP
jgi:uncharacterized membrane protein